MKRILSITVVFICYFKISTCQYDPVAHLDPSCFQNISLTETPDMELILDDSEKIVNYVETPNFEELSGTYIGDRRCGWYFWSVNTTAFITLDFGFFHLEENKDCSLYDYVRFYRRGFGQVDWEDITQFNRGKGFCGHIEPFKIETYATSLYVEFIADTTKEEKGFNFTYFLTFPEDTPKITCIGELNDTRCNHTITINERENKWIQCTTEASLRPAVDFVRVTPEGDAPLRRGFVKTLTENGEMELFDAQLSDEGLYKCVSRNKAAQEHRLFNIKVNEKCRCPKKIRLVWYNYPPYTQYVDSFDRDQLPIFKGIYHTVLERMLREVCGKCSKGHGESELVWSSVDNRQKTLLDVKNEISSGEFDVALPILNYDGVSLYRGYFFLPLFNAPEVTFLVPANSDGAAAIFSGIWSVAPVLALAVILMILAGIIVWILDTYWNEDEFPRAYFRGIAEGAWWAYITMTTVGYGDIAPRGNPGKAFSVIWIMTGLVIVSILMGAISTALTIASFNEPLPIYGAKVGAIKHSEEFKLGLTKNAEVVGYDTFEDILKAINKGDIEGMLVDKYLSSYYTELHKLLKNSDIERENVKFGVVFGKGINDSFVHQLLQRFVDNEEFLIEQAVADNKGGMPESPEFNLMDPKGKLFVTSIISLVAMLVACVLIGIVYDYAYKQPRKIQVLEAKNLDMLEDQHIKLMAKSTQVLTDSSLKDMQMASTALDDRFENLEKKHQYERSYFNNKHEDRSSLIELQTLKKRHSQNQMQSEENNSRSQLTKLESSA